MTELPVSHFTRRNGEIYYGSMKGEMKEHAQLEAGLSAAYIRAIAKVAFHYHLWTPMADTGAEFHCQPIRQFIRHGEGDSRQFVEVSGPQFVGDLKDGNVPTQFSHFFGVTKVGNQLLGLVQFFVGPEHMTPPAPVHLAQTRRYFPNQGHWVAYYGERVKGFDGEIKELKIRQ